MSGSTAAPTRNWGGVVIAVAGAFELLGTALNGAARSIPDFPTTYFGTIFGIQAAAVALVPIALFIGFVPIAFGGNGLVSLAGGGRRARRAIFLAALLALVAQFAIVVVFVFTLGEYRPSIPTASTATAAIAVFALLVEAIAGVIIARASVARGFARWSLLVAVALIAVTTYAWFHPLIQNWDDVPRAVGLVLLGLSYWRAGLVPRSVVAAE